jgi:hypothetical protein
VTLISVEGFPVTITDSGRGEAGWTEQDGTQHRIVWDKAGVDDPCSDLTCFGWQHWDLMPHRHFTSKR